MTNTISYVLRLQITYNVSNGTSNPTIAIPPSSGAVTNYLAWP